LARFIYNEKMSGLNLVRAIDPRTDVGGFSRKTFAVFDGASEVGYQRISPDGGVSNSLLTFTCDPPSPQVYVNRRALVEITFDLTFTGVSAGAGIRLLQMAGCRSSTGANVGTQNLDAPRAFPIANALTNISLMINNNTITQNLNSYIRAFTRYSMSGLSEDINYGLTPSMLDQAQNYSDLTGFARSPLRGYGDNAYQCPRGGFVGIDVLSNTATGIADTAVVRLTCSEYLFLSPMLFQEDDQDTGFYGVQNMKLQLSLGGRGNSAISGLGASLWSHASGSGAISSIAVNVVEAQALFSYLTPDPTQQIPYENLYPYYQPQVYPTNTTVPISSGALTTIQMNNVQLGSIPSCLYLFVGETDSNHNVLKSDVFFGIENIAVSFDNRDNLLANATPQDLFNIAVKNGTNLSWTQWSRDVGSVLRLDFGADICLKMLQAVGMRGSFNLRLTVQARNLGSVAQIPTLTCVVVSEGIMSIAGNNVQFNLGVLDQQDIMASKSMPEVVYHSSGNLFGGSFWNRLGSFAQKAGKFVQRGIRPAIDIAKKLAPALAPEFSPYVEKADEVARALGYGKRGRRGGGLVGGKNLSRAQLSSMLKG
jgi:hypothetical protein